MRLLTSCRFEFEIQHLTPFVLMLRPRSGAQQWVAREEYQLTPMVPAEEFTDEFGNLCQRLTVSPGAFRIDTTAEVVTSDRMDEAPGAPYMPIQFLPVEVLCYLHPSRYCESDCFGQMATEITAGCTPGYDQVAAITSWVRDTISYIPGSSTVPVTAGDINQRGSGVCRDLSHLGIAMCRALSIPARMVVGYLHGLEPMDLHAWFEAYVGGRWYTFDATQRCLRAGYVALGFGRDAADVAVYNQYGPSVFPMSSFVSVSRLD